MKQSSAIRQRKGWSLASLNPLQFPYLMRDGRVENQRAYSGVCSGEGGRGEPAAKPGPLRPWAGGEDGIAPLESEWQGKLNRLSPATPQRDQ